MILLKKTVQLQNYLQKNARAQRTIGFAPTMGALHEGHISLIDRSKKENDITVTSIFINPTQFNDPADFQKYPITIEEDIAMLEEAGCDVLFLPGVEEIYPDGLDKTTHYDLGMLENLLEGKYRPGHFQGVCMVVHRLLDIVKPHTLYIGQKDYQQCMVITRLVELMGKESTIAIQICPTLREDDGLAMSSRNRRLNKEERQTASTIYKALSMINDELKQGDNTSLISKAEALLASKGFKTDYVAIADAVTLEPVVDWDGNKDFVALIAAFLGPVRLIDNMLLRNQR